MTAPFVFAIVALVQAIFLVLLVLFLLVRRAYDRRQQAVFVSARAGISEPLRNWLVAGAHPEPVVAALRELPRGTAVGYVALLARQTIPDTQREELAVSLRNEAWVTAALKRTQSRYWWHRLEAARALSLVGTEKDRDAVKVLMMDSHPAVQVAAVSALLRVADDDLIGFVLDRIFGLPKVVRQYLTNALWRARGLIGDELANRVRGGDDRLALASWIELAEAVDDGHAISAAIHRADHPAEAVRRSVARALRRRPAEDSQRVLFQLLEDHEPSVRAAAARTLGELGLTTAVPALTRTLSDRAWIVRLRSAVALAQTGERGRNVLRKARMSGDKYAREMASMVSGLSDGALLELDDS